MISDEIEGIERSPVVIRKRRLFRIERSWLMMLPFAAFVAGLSVQMAMLASVVSTPDPAGTIVLMIGTFVLLLAAASVLWNLLGQEVVAIEGGELVVRREILGIGRSRRLAAGLIKDISMRSWNPPELRESLWGLGVGKVRIAIDGKEYTLGIALSDSEAGLLAQRLLSWKTTATNDARVKGGNA